MTNELRCAVKLIIVAFLVSILLNVFIAPVHAAVGDEAMSNLLEKVKDLAKNDWLVQVQTVCLQLLGVTAIIGFAIGLKDLAVAGQLSLEGIVALLVRYAFIIGVLLWVLGGAGGGKTGADAALLMKIPESIAKIGSKISGVQANFDGILVTYAEVMGPILDLWSRTWFYEFGLIITLLLVIFFLNVMFFMMAATVLVVQLEMIFIFIGGMFTACFFVIPYFKDIFMGYVKGLATVGVKLLLMSLLLGAMLNIMTGWTASFSGGNEKGIVDAAMQVCCALVAFYMILQSVPQYASAIMTGSATAGGGGLVAGAIAAGVGTAMTVVNASKLGASKITNAGSAVSQAAQTYQYTAQAARDTGSTPGQARAAGFKEAFSTIMTGPQQGGSRAAGDRIYSDYQRGQQFADVRNGGANSNTVSAPSSGGATGGNNTGGNKNSPTPSSHSAGSDNVTIAGSSYAPASYSAAAAAGAGRDAGRNAGREAAHDSWGAFASDRKRNGGGNNV